MHKYHPDPPVWERFGYPSGGGGGGSGAVSSVFTRTGAVVAVANDYTDALVQNSPTNKLTTTGDLLIASGANTLARLAVGSAWQFLGVSAGLPAWAAPTPTAYITRTAGSLTLNNSAAYVELAAATGGPGTGGFDMTFAASINDIIMFFMNASLNTAATSVKFDIATMVAGSPVNTVGGSALNTANDGIGGWSAPSSVFVSPGTCILYKVVVGDISGGNVTFRPYYFTGAAVNRTLNAIAAVPLQMGGVNLHH